MLIMIGLFHVSWSRRRLLNEIVLLVMVLSVIFLMLTAQHVEFRYGNPIVPLTLPWVAKGLNWMGWWGRKLAIGAGALFAGLTRPAGFAVQGAVCAPMLVLSLISLPRIWDFKIERDTGGLCDKRAALW